MSQSTRRTFLKQSSAGALLAAAGLPASGVYAKGSDKPTNVLILKSDEHNPFISSIHGHPFVQTPNMDRLAKQGVTFANTYCASPLCMPSRSSFVSGRRVHDIQTYSNCNLVKEDFPTYGRVLDEQGVYSVHAGKTDFYNVHSKLGFSETILPRDRGGKGADTHIRRSPLHIREGARARANGFGVNPGNFKRDLKCNEKSIEWLEQKAPTLDRPWSMEVNLVKPHFPHQCTQEMWDLYASHDDLPAHGVEAESAKHPYAQDLRDHFEAGYFSGEQTRGLRQGYYGCVTFIDRQLGRLMDTIEKAGLAENTVVAYTSDHGEMLGKFGMWWKCSLFEDSVRVPLLVSGPGFDTGTRTETPVDLLDLQATIFRATGAERPKDWVGVPLQDIPQNDPTRAVFSEYHGHGTRASGYLIRKGNWKLLYNVDAPHQLFDLEADPDELNNLAGSKPEIADIESDLESELRKICDPELENERTEERIVELLAAIPEAQK